MEEKMEDLTALTIEEINGLIDEAGYGVEVSASSFIQINASNEAQYQLTYFSTVAGQIVVNHAFVDVDLQGDVRLKMSDIGEGDMNLRNETPPEE
tara:strand:- start:742 stop:1026 length:285 start_codon:yes stop_codon:yes gene_type:complete